MDEHCVFLTERGVAESSHHNGSLLKHLQGTQRLLTAWGCDEHVSLAGLYHSVYGTSFYSCQSVCLTERDAVRSRIGRRGEWLVFLFCVADRPRAFIDALSTSTLTNRFDGTDHHVDDRLLNELLEIECANLLEQSLGWRFIGQLYEAHKSGVLPLKASIASALFQGLREKSLAA